MKSCIPIRLFLLACSCACVLCCRVRVPVPNFKQLENAAAESARNAVQVMGKQMTRFTEESTKLLQTMGSSVTQFLKDMSGNVERGIVMVEWQVKGIREDTNTHLEAMGKNVTNFLGELLKRVDNASEVFNKEITPRITSILDNFDITVKKSHSVMDIGILLLLLFGFYVSRYLRLLTGNDFVSRLGYIILSLLELIFLVGAVAVLVITLHKFVTGKEIEYEMLLRAVAVLVNTMVNTLHKLVTDIENEMSPQFTVLFFVSIIVFLWVLPLAWKIVKALLVIFSWPLQRNLSVRLRVGLSSLFTIVISVLYYYSTSSIDFFIISCVIFLGIGVCINVVMHFT